MGFSGRFDGDHKGWIVVLALWTRLFIWVGIYKSFGMMIPILQDQFDTTTWILGGTISIIGTATGLAGIFARLIGKSFQIGSIILTCGLMSAFCPILAAFATSPALMSCTFILFAGTAFGVSGVLLKEAIGRHFTRNYATATGIARTGDSIGLFVLAPLIHLFLDTYGWRGTMLLLGGIFMHFIACGALTLVAGASSTGRYQELPTNDVTSEQRQNPDFCAALFENLVKIFDIRLLADYRFWSIAIITCSTKYSFNMWIIYFVSQAQSNEFSLEQAATFVTVGGIGGLLGKLFQGYLVDREIISSCLLMGTAATICSVSFCATPWLISYWSMMTSSFLILTCSGVMSCLHDVLSKQVLGVDLLAGTFGWLGITGAIVDGTLGFLPGWTYDTTGSYIPAFIFIGSTQSLVIFPLLVLRCRGCVE